MSVDDGWAHGIAAGTALDTYRGPGEVHRGDPDVRRELRRAKRELALLRVNACSSHALSSRVARDAQFVIV
ncbi:hypothetical protein GCM10018775_26330 [Streptomyces umbrinus]|nr:hypothetical protein GCM10018775_26330 [Streptomyces umbrinus]